MTDVFGVNTVTCVHLSARLKGIYCLSRNEKHYVSKVVIHCISYIKKNLKLSRLFFIIYKLTIDIFFVYNEILAKILT